MALDTYVVAAHIVEVCGINDVGFRRMLNMQAARPVALLTADIPFGYLPGLNVVID